MRHSVKSITIAAFLLSSTGCYAQEAPSSSNVSPTFSVEKTNVVFHSGSVRLAGTLVFPNMDAPTPALIVLHSASGASRNYHFYEHLTELLPKLGIAVLVFDRRGHGESSGNFRAADFDDLATDALAALEFLASRPHIDAKRIGVWGVSQGGWIAPRAASKSESIAFVISVSGPGVSPAEQMIYSAETALRLEGYSDDVVERAAALRRRVDEYFRGNVDRHLVQQEIDRVREEPWFQHVSLPNRGRLPRDASSSKWFQEMDYDPLPVLASITAPMLFLFGELDRWVPVTTSIDKLKAATISKEEVTIVSIEAADHYLMIPDSTEEDAQSQRLSQEYTRILQTWLQKHLAL